MSFERVSQETREWIEWFDRSPGEALVAALDSRVYFGTLNAIDPERLLVDWTRAGFISTGSLDEALQQGVFGGDDALKRFNVCVWIKVVAITGHLRLPRATQNLMAIRERLQWAFSDNRQLRNTLIVLECLDLSLEETLRRTRQPV